MFIFLKKQNRRCDSVLNMYSIVCSNMTYSQVQYGCAVCMFSMYASSIIDNIAS